MAARLTIEGGVISVARLAVGAAAPTPVLIPGIPEILEGKPPGKEIFAEAGEIAAQVVKPISDLRGSAEYRRELVRVLSVRALSRARARCGDGEAGAC